MASCVNSKTDLFKESRKAGNLWSNDKNIKAWGMDQDSGMFATMFETVTDKPFESGAGLNATDYKKMQIAIKEFSKSLSSPGALSSKIVQNVFIGKSLAKKNPLVQTFYERMQRAGEYRNSQTQDMMKNYGEMISNFKLALLEFNTVDTNTIDSQFSSGEIQARNFIKPGVIKSKRDVNQAFNRLDALESSYYKKGGQSSPGKEYTAIKKYLAGGKDQTGEGKVFQDLFDYIDTGNIDSIKNRYIISDNRGRNIIDPNKTQYIKKIEEAGKSWKQIEIKARGHIIKSIELLNDNIKMKYGEDSNTTKRLVEEYSKIAKDLEKFEGNYAPHYILDIIGDNAKIADNIARIGTKGFDTEKTKANVMREAIANAENISTKLSNRLKYRRKGKQEEYFSRNPVMYAQKYIQQILQFNHSTFVDNAYAKGLTDLTAVMLKNPNSRYEKTAKTYLNIMNDMYGATTNKNRIKDDPTASNIVRLLTSLQFTAKMGFSTRGAIRNSTQRLLEFVHIGGLAQIDAMQEYRSNTEFKKLAEEQLARHGLLFTEANQATEGALGRTDMIADGIELKQYSDGTYSLSKTDFNLLEKGVRASTKIAETSSILTKSVENWNRKGTFKLAFHKRFKQLQKTDAYRNALEGTPEYKELTRKAGNYAAKLTTILHFDYSPTGKAKLMRGGVGAILGQFQHYAMSFGQLQYQMVKDYKNAVKAGDYTGPELGKIIRTMMLLQITEVASILGDINFTSYIQNDSIERLKGMFELFDEDPDNQKEAFYGKGAIGAVGLMPITDAVEILNLGVAAGYWNHLADPETNAGIMLGMRDYDKIDNTEFAKEIASMFSIQGERSSRAIFGDSGLLGSGGLMGMIRTELGLYPGVTAMGVKTRQTRRKLLGLQTRTEKKLSKPLFKRGGVKSRLRRRKKSGGLNKVQKDRALRSLGNF